MEDPSSNANMSLGRQDFLTAWRWQGEDTSPKISEIAWRRYQHVQNSSDAQSITAAEGPTLSQLEKALTPLVQTPSISSLVAEYKFISIPSNTVPWKPTGLTIQAGVLVSTFATGRIWRSKLLDLFFSPQFGLYFRVGVNGRVFNSTRDTNTFQSFSAGELYLAPQYPGQFSNPKGGRINGQLKKYEVANNKGAYQVLVIVWKENVTHEDVINALNGTLNGDNRTDAWFGLVDMEVERLTDDYLTRRFPRGWHNLWFIGDNEIYTSETFDGHKGIRCCPDQNVGIIQTTFDPAVPFTKDFTVAWDWCIKDLPSRLREDTTITHDYLSLAFEFENGRDLTYTWSWELPLEYGYWCPLATWEDREYHVVIRTGTEQLGQWLSEKRNLYGDYKKYIGFHNMPTQVVRVWLIAGNRWQRHKGEMLIRRIRMGDLAVL